MTTAVMVILSLMMIGVAFALSSRNVFLNRMRENASQTAGDVSAAAEAYGLQGELDSLQLRLILTAVGEGTDQEIFITNADGYVVSCSDRDLNCPHMGKQLSEGSVDSWNEDEGKRPSFSTLDGFFDTNHYVIISPLYGSDGSLMGTVYVCTSLSNALADWSSIVPLFGLISLIVLAVALIFSYVCARYVTAPLKAMTAAARKFGHGDLSVRVEKIPTTDELGELTEAFNSMADSLEKSENQRSEFVANVSHELKTPMTTIAGFADGILDGTIPPESEKKYLQIISSETKRLNRLVRSMLELSRLQAEDRTALLQKSFDIAEVLRVTLLNFVDKIEEHKLDVDFQVPEDAVYVLGDTDALTQVVYNLLDNAIKFAEPGTQLGISLWKDAKKCYVSVRNHGATIPESEIPLLFDRFHKADRSRSRNKDGVGLGLYIVKTILNNHGEDIAVTSREGVTDFVFTLALKETT